MKSRVLMFMAGLISGALLMVFFDLSADHAGNTAVSNNGAVQQQLAEDRSRAVPVDIVESPSRSESASYSDDDVIYFLPIDHSDISMPTRYKEMIGPLEPSRITFSERHASFAVEPRDEPWAVAMETGINDYLAAAGPGDGMVFEYVECRTRTCEVAGYIVDEQAARGFDTDDLVEQSWWQGGRATSSIGPKIDGTKHFVIIFFHGKRYAQ